MKSNPVQRRLRATAGLPARNSIRGSGTLIIILAAPLLTGCAYSPTFDIDGSIFPAWLVCLAIGIVLTVAARWLFFRFHIVIVFPTLVYPGLVALLTLLIWLVFFE